MIAKLRRQHRVIFPVLGIIIIVIAVLGLQEKPDIQNEILPGYLNKNTEEMKRYSSSYFNRYPSINYQLEVFSSEDSYYLRLTFIEEKKEPDVLIYFNQDGSKEVTDSSKLIGTYTEKRFYKLPSSNVDYSSIVLYSLPKKEILAVGSIQNQGDSQ